MKALADVHVHNFLSNCSRDRTATAKNYIKRYADLGVKVLGFANHTWDDRVPGNNEWYHKQNLAFEMQIKNQIPADTLGVKVLVGAETEFCGMTKTLGMTAEGAKELDFLLIPHSHVHMRNFVMPDIPEVLAARKKIERRLIKEWGINEDKAAEMARQLKQKDLEPFFEGERTDYPKYVADFLVQSFEDLMNHPELEKILKVTPVSIAHPFQPCGDGSISEEIVAYISDSTFHRLFKMAADKGIGLEINPYCNTVQRLRFNKIALEEGCKFTLGSDTHTIQGAETIFKTEETLQALGLTEENLMDFIRS